MSRFRVLQFNMQFGQIWDEADPLRAPIDLEMTLAEIRRHNADIIFLQEVEHAQGGGIQLQPPPNYLHLRAEHRPRARSRREPNHFERRTCSFSASRSSSSRARSLTSCFWILSTSSAFCSA